jgi:aminopeptidase N
MLRRYMGDDRFERLLAELPKRYRGSVVTTEGFRHTAAEFLPPKSTDPTLENFFETWVYGTGIPALKLDYSVRGKAPSLRVSGTVRQTGVDEEFSADIPIEVQSGKGAAEMVKWVRTGDSPSGFTVAVKQAGVKLSLPLQSVLAVRR